MSKGGTERAYRLHHMADHLIDMTYDISLVHWPGSHDIDFADKDLGRLPTPLRFVANFATIRKLDYPIAQPRELTVMRPQMMAALLSAGAFEHHVHPVVLIDDTCDPAKRYRDDGTLRPEICDASFGFVRLTSYVDAFDWERSRYERDSKHPGFAFAVTKLVLRDVPLPPLFRLAAYPYPLFVSHAGRVALEKAQIRGVDFSPYWTGFEPPDGAK